MIKVTRGAATSEPKPTRKALEEAQAEAARTASRASTLGALGFGLALVMGSVLASNAGFLQPGFGLEMILFVGGLGGGLLFTVLALRASRMARICKQRLDDEPHSRRGS